MARHGDLAEPLDDAERGRHDLVRGELRPHHLDERHQRCRVEEVQPDDPIRPRRRGGDLRHRQRRRVRREHGSRVADPFELDEERALRAELLHDRLDHEVARREVGEVGRRRQAPERGLALVLRLLSLFDLPGEKVADPPRGGVGEVCRHLPADDLEAGFDPDLRDSGPHRAEADDSDPLHGRRHGRGPYPPVSAVVAAAAIDVVDPRVAACEDCERADDENEDDQCDSHACILLCGYY